MSKLNTSSTPPSLAAILRKYRLRAGYSQKNVAEILGISRSAYTYYETGKTSPDPVTLHQIARIFGVGLDDFFVEAEGPQAEELVLHDSGAERKRSPRKAKADPQRAGELTSAEKTLIAYLRSQNIPGDKALEVLKQFYEYYQNPNGTY